MHRLKGASLLEAIVAAVIFLLVFAAAMELMPRMAVHRDDTLLLVEADHRAMQAFSKYATGDWPDGDYDEPYDWGEVRIRLLPHPDHPDLQSVEVAAHIRSNRKIIRIRQWVARSGLKFPALVLMCPSPSSFSPRSLAIGPAMSRSRGKKSDRREPQITAAGKFKPLLKASTLVETLVMMIVAGIVFLGVMDGLTLFTRLQLRTTERMQAGSRTVDGYYRTESLVAAADSAATGAPNRIMLYRSGRPSQLFLNGDALVFAAGEFRDTLLKEVQSLRLHEDTVAIGLQNFTIKFPTRPRRTEEGIERIEQGYGYEE